jgi:hypothetical protein
MTWCNKTNFYARIDDEEEVAEKDDEKFVKLPGIGQQIVIFMASANE